MTKPVTAKKIPILAVPVATFDDFGKNLDLFVSKSVFWCLEPFGYSRFQVIGMV